MSLSEHINDTYVLPLSIIKQIKELEAKCDELKSLLADQTLAHSKTIERERTLAAHVERLDAPATVFIENVQEAVELLLSMGPAENIVALTQDLIRAADSMEAALNKGPTSSLARLKAGWCEDTAAHFMELADNARENGYMTQADAVEDMAQELKDKATTLRRQAEEAHDTP